MKLGLGLYRHMLTRENFQFARQAGATHIVAHFVDYFRGSGQDARDDQPTGTDRGWGLAGDADKLWSLEEMVAVRREVEAAGLKLEAIENFDPAHWHDILLDGPKRPLQEFPRFAPGADTSQTVMVPASGRATSAVLVDRLNGTRVPVPWPPDDSATPAAAPAATGPTPQ